ncbi:MAG: DUF1622 domain-containing protein [Rhizobium rhizophilum]|uniref:DUF1622 domain-containing protein n=1 Tax=Rhizobium rhizophilum TaxID=1850373 RepID=UPI00391B5163
MNFAGIMHVITRMIEAVGVAVIVIGIAVAGIAYLKAPGSLDAYSKLRAGMGRAILLGLELMVAGDIINTVAVEPSLDSVLVLAVIVVIRTFLSLSLEVEISGRWPWQGVRSSQSLHRGKENGDKTEDAD